MIDLKIYALTLIVLRLMSLALLFLVLKKQWRLFRLPVALNDKTLLEFRRVLFAITIIIFIGNVIPLFIDVLTMFGLTSRPDFIKIPSYIYQIITTSVGGLTSLLIWRLYKLAADEKAITDFAEKTLHQK